MRYGRSRLLPWLASVGCDCAAAEELVRRGGGQPDESVVQHGGWQGRVAPWQDRKKRREAQMKEEMGMQMKEEIPLEMGMRDA